MHIFWTRYSILSSKKLDTITGENQAILFKQEQGILFCIRPYDIQPLTTTNLIRRSFSVYSAISASHFQAEWQLIFNLVYKYTVEECILSVTVTEKFIQLMCGIGNFTKIPDGDISEESITHFLSNRFKAMHLLLDRKQKDDANIQRRKLDSIQFLL